MHAGETDAVDRVRLLVAHGVDVIEAYPDRRTPMDLARLGAFDSVAEALAAGGAPRAELDRVDELIAAMCAGEAGNQSVAGQAVHHDARFGATPLE